MFCFAVLYVTVVLFSYSPIPFFKRYLSFLSDLGYSPLATGLRIKIYRAGYHIARVLDVALCLLITVRAWRYYKKRSRFLLFPGENEWLQPFSDIIRGNQSLLQSLPLVLRASIVVFLVAQLALSIYLTFSIPYFYDEAWSYAHFSGRGLPATIGYYPAPNNHVLFNVFGCIFNILPLDPVLVLRLPSVLFGLLSTWYFFKLGARLFSPLTAVLMAMLLGCSFPCVCYNSMGRGYSMLIFFSILSLYGLAQICTGGARRKYLALFCVASIAGFYTIPSFLYCWLPAAFMLFLYYLLNYRKEVFRYIESQVDVVALVIFLYLPIMIFNGPDVLVANNGVIKRDIAYINEHVREHFVNTWNWLIGTDKIPFIGFLIFTFVLLLRTFAVKKSGNRLVMSLFVLLLISPVAFIYVQKTIPFERNWSFLIIPLIAGVGIFVNDIGSLLSKRVKKIPYLLVVIPFVMACMIYAYYLVGVRKQMYANDYYVQEYAKQIKDKLGKISTVGFIDEDINFYLAEDILFESIRHTGSFETQLQWLQEGDTPQQDIIVLWRNGKKLNFEQGNYILLKVDSAYWDVYLKKDLGDPKPASQ